MEYFKQIKGNTWYLQCAVSVPIYFLNENTVVMLDCSYREYDGDFIRDVLKETGLTVRAVINSHTHADHTGNNNMLRDEFGAEIIANYVEDALAANPTTLTNLYRLITPGDAEKQLSHLVCKADRVFYPLDRFVEVEGVKFPLHYLPGHTVGHTAIATPDDVLYLGDALISEATLEMSKLMTIMNWAEDARSKERIRNLKYSYYVLAHEGVYDEINTLVDQNIRKKEEILNFILDCLKKKDEWTHSEIEIELYTGLRLHSDSFKRVSMFRRNILNAVEYLVDTGKIKRCFKSGTYYYSVI